MLNKIKNLNTGLAAGVMVLMFIIAIFLGNARAIGNAQKECDRAFEPMQEAIADIRGEAANLLVLAQRYGASCAEQLEESLSAVAGAKDPKETAQFNAQLMESAASVQEELKEILKDNDKNGDLKNLQAVMDDFNSHQNILNRLAKTYNETAAQAQEIYRKVPAKFLLGSAPEAFE